MLMIVIHQWFSNNCCHKSTFNDFKIFDIATAVSFSDIGSLFGSLFGQYQYQMMPLDTLDILYVPGILWVSKGSTE